MNNNGLLKASAPVLRLGRKTFAVEHGEWKGTPQLTVSEVQAVPDDKDPTRVAGWAGVFKGTRIMGKPEDVHAWALRLVELTAPPTKAAGKA